jgi:CBS domain-containing protein
MVESPAGRLFHTILKALPEEQELIVLEPDVSVREALALLDKYNVSQIPIVKGKDTLGVFSYRSFAKRLAGVLPIAQQATLDVPVEEFIEQLRYASIKTRMAEWIGELDLMDAVLVGSEDKLHGVLTTIDALKYFYEIASPYVLIKEIELGLRQLIQHTVNESDLSICMELSLGKYYSENDKPIPKELKELTFYDYVMMLRFGKTYSYFKKALGGTEKLTYARLKPLPEIRNNIFHFRGDPSIEEYQILRDTRDWLRTRMVIVFSSESFESSHE